MDDRNARLAVCLTYAGTLPLLVCAVAKFLPVDHPDPVPVAIAYGAVIASFLSGIHWAIELFKGAPRRRNLLIYSNGIALSAWVALLAGPVAACILLILCFLALLKFDRELTADSVYPAWYWTLRRNATVVVTLALAAIGLESFLG